MVAQSRTQSSNQFNRSLQRYWKKNGRDLFLPILGILGFLIIWQLLSSAGITKLPGPLSLWTNERARALLLYPFYNFGGSDKGLFWQTIASLGRVAQGYILAAIVGISLGVLVGVSPILNKALDPLFQFLRMIAPLAWVPIALIALQQNQPAAIFVIFITALWPILINTAEGVRQLPQDYVNVARVLKISRWTYFSKILMPSALPYIFTGLRISIGLAWLAIIAAEIVMGGGVGIGFFIWESYQQNYVSEVILAVIYIGAFGLLLDKFMSWLQGFIVPAAKR